MSTKALLWHGKRKHFCVTWDFGEKTTYFYKTKAVGYLSYRKVNTHIAENFAKDYMGEVTA